MRTSIVRTDPGFSTTAYRQSVTLDGRVVWFCQTADEEEGYVDTFTIQGHLCFSDIGVMGYVGNTTVVDVDSATMLPVVRRTYGVVRITDVKPQVLMSTAKGSPVDVVRCSVPIGEPFGGDIDAATKRIAENTAEALKSYIGKTLSLAIPDLTQVQLTELTRRWKEAKNSESPIRFVPSAVTSWTRTSERLPTADRCTQVHVLFCSPGWACPLVGQFTYWDEDDRTWSVYDQQEDRFRAWEGPQPEFWMPRPDVPSGMAV